MVKVYIVQECGEGAGNVHVYAKQDDAANHTQDLIEYGDLTDEYKNPVDTSTWDGEKELDLWNDEGEIVVRLYNAEVK